MHTGHSLGGILADIYGGSMVPVITFENPGSKEIVIKVIRQALEEAGFPPSDIEKAISETLKNMLHYCNAYQADVNMINTCNQQVGKLFRLSDLDWDYNVYRGGPMLPILPYFIENPYYFAYTLDQHKMENIANYLQSNGNFLEEHYPFGFQPGYIAYLDGKNRKKYWDGYVSRIWATHSEIREEYKGDWSKYYKFFYWKLDQIQAEARGDLQKNLLLDLGSMSISHSRDASSREEPSSENVSIKPDKKRSLFEQFLLFRTKQEEVTETKEDYQKKCEIV